jgi:hypothetical protein
LGFVCSFCGQQHDEQMLDIRAQFPDPVFVLSDEERASRADFGDDAGVLDPDSSNARFFVRGLVELPIRELDDFFAYGAWAEVDEDSFGRIGDLWWDESGSDEPPFPAVLANELEPYVATTGLACELQLREVNRVPSITMRSEDHPLSSDQSSGITLQRVHELAATVS